MPRPKTVRRLVMKCALAAVSLTLGLGLAEVVARGFLPEVSDSFVIQTGAVEEKFHHKPLWGELPPPDPEAFRVAFIGDTFTYGYPVKDRAKAFPAVVGRLFSEGSVDGVGPRRVQAYNLGTPSYSPSIYGVVLRELAPVLKPHLIVVSLDDSDPQDDLFCKPLLKTDANGLPVSVYPGLPGVPDWLKPLARQVKLVRLTFGLGDKVYRRFVAGDPKTLKRWESRLGHYRPGPGSDEQWAGAFRHTLALVGAMHAYCAARRIGLCVVNYPYPPAVTTKQVVAWRKMFHFGTDRLYEPTFHAAARSFCEGRRVPYYDFTPCLRSLPDHEGLFISDDDPHYSPKGNALLARELVRFLAPLVDTPTDPNYDRMNDRGGTVTTGPGGGKSSQESPTW